MDGGLGRTRTTGSGRFTFGGLATGRYKVTVITAGTNYLSTSQDVEFIGTSLGRTTEISYVDVRLRFDPRRVQTGSDGPAEAIFVQDVPESARKFFKKGLPDIATDKGLKLVEEAIGAYPDYFDALVAAGREYIRKGEHQTGAVYLVRAVGINQRSYSAYSSLAYAAYKLNKISEALEAARLAFALEPKAIPTRVMLGKLLRLSGELKLAESVLIETKKLSPDTPQAYYELALVYNREKRNSDAADELEQYLKLAPNDPERKAVEELIGKLRQSTSVSKFNN
jgi:tetratricopeptide (TPR) repeat protein